MSWGAIKLRYRDSKNVFFDGEASPAQGGGSTPITAPTEIANCVLWLDASQLALSNADPVPVWPDLSGSGFDATQSDNTKQPVYLVAGGSGGNAIPAHPIVNFDGATQFLELLGAGLGILNGKPGATIALVGRSAEINSGYGQFWASIAGDATTARLGFADGTMPWQVPDEGAAVVGVSFATSGAGAYISLLAVIDAAGTGNSFARSAQASFNAWNSTTADNADTPASFGADDPAVVQIGQAAPGEFYAGDLGEIIVYDRALTLSEQNELAEYLSAKWKLP